MFKLPVKRNNEDWYPFSEIENLHKEMNRLFDFSFPRFGQADQSLLSGQWGPAIDILETKDNFEIKADLPGFKKEDIHVSVQEEVLTISGERKEETKNKEEGGHMSTERYYGSFQRRVVLPVGIDPKKLNAVFKDGVLELTLGKREDAKPKQITIDVK